MTFHDTDWFKGIHILDCYYLSIQKLLAKGSLASTTLSSEDSKNSSQFQSQLFSMGFHGFFAYYSWWFFTNPSEKYAQVKLDHFRRGRSENKKCLSCHHLDYIYPHLGSQPQFSTRHNLDYDKSPANQLFPEQTT